MLTRASADSLSGLGPTPTISQSIARYLPTSTLWREAPLAYTVVSTAPWPPNGGPTEPGKDSLCRQSLVHSRISALLNPRLHGQTGLGSLAVRCHRALSLP